MGLFGTKKTKRRIKEDGSLIVLDKVSKSYSTGAPALNGVNLRIKKGEFVFIVGDSGSGKSTLIKLLLRELTPTSGTILVNGQNVADLRPRQIPRYRRNLGIVFQDFRLLKDRNVYENVAFAQRIIQVPTKEIKRNVPAILATVGLAGKYKAKPKQLSGGEQQRVSIARALAKNPKLLLCDEPTGALDYNTGKAILKLLQDTCRKKGMTVILITHNSAIAPMADRVIKIKNGKVSKVTLNENPISVETIEW